MSKARLRPNGRWQLESYIGRDPDGRKISKTFTCDTEAACYKAERDWLRSGGKAERESHKGGVTLGECMDKYIETCEKHGYSPSTVRGYGIIRRNGFPTLIDRPILDITAEDVQDEFNRMDCSPKTMQNRFGLLRPVAKRYAPKLNLSLIVLSKKKKKPKRHFDRDLPQRLLADKNVDHFIYLALIVSTGMRPSEIYSLTWGDISKEPMISIDGGVPIKYGTISVSKATVLTKNDDYALKDTKTDAGTRVLQVSWALIERICQLRPRGKDDARIVRIMPKSITSWWFRLRRRNLVPENITYYDMRHYFATALYEAGATEEELKDQMGHTTGSFTHEVYIEMFADTTRTVNARMAQNTERLYTDIEKTQKKAISSRSQLGR